MNWHKASKVLGGIVVCGTLAVAATLSVATTNPGSNCCFTQTCGDKSVTDCRSSCASNEVCSGEGGCTPSAWANAKCIKHP